MTFTKKYKQPKATWMLAAGAVPIRSRQKQLRHPKPRTRLRQRSMSMAAKMRDYNAMRLMFLIARPLCQCRWDGVPCRNAATEVHHRHGRVGDLLLYTPLWLATCSACHSLIERDRPLARRNGLLAQHGHWNRMPAAVVSLEAAPDGIHATLVDGSVQFLTVAEP